MIVPAEIISKPNQAHKAARVLQTMGFRILQIGPIISLQAPQALWESTFQITFLRKTKTLSKETGTETSFQEASKDSMKFPVELENIIEDVCFVKPPEFFSRNQY
jgi:hypothetical protein